MLHACIWLNAASEYCYNMFVYLLVDCNLLPNGVVNCTSDTTVTAITPAEEDTCTFCCNAGHYALQGSTNRICISEADPFCITGYILINSYCAFTNFEGLKISRILV